MSCDVECQTSIPLVDLDASVTATILEHILRTFERDIVNMMLECVHKSARKCTMVSIKRFQDVIDEASSLRCTSEGNAGTGTASEDAGVPKASSEPEESRRSTLPQTPAASIGISASLVTSRSTAGAWKRDKRRSHLNVPRTKHAQRNPVLQILQSRLPKHTHATEHSSESSKSSRTSTTRRSSRTSGTTRSHGKGSCRSQDSSRSKRSHSSKSTMSSRSRAKSVGSHFTDVRHIRESSYRERGRQREMEDWSTRLTSSHSKPRPKNRHTAPDVQAAWSTSASSSAKPLPSEFPPWPGRRFPLPHTDHYDAESTDSFTSENEGNGTLGMRESETVIDLKDLAVHAPYKDAKDMFPS